MINLRKTLSEVNSVLKKENISCALIGGFALAAYGIHRSTSDVDFLADGKRKEDIKRLLQEKGYNLRYESSEVLQFGGAGFVDVLLANRPLSLEMLKSAQNNPELNVYVLKAEDIIGLKIQAYKNDSLREYKDKADIQEILNKNSGLDMSRIKFYADLFGEWEVIKSLGGAK